MSTLTTISELLTTPSYYVSFYYILTIEALVLEPLFPQPSYVFSGSASLEDAYWKTLTVIVVEGVKYMLS
jgi:hypothetical protein